MTVSNQPGAGAGAVERPNPVPVTRRTAMALRPLPKGRKGAMCATKKRYRSEYQALDVAADLRKNRGRDCPALRAYLCPFCTGWHLTKSKTVHHGETT